MESTIANRKGSSRLQLAVAIALGVCMTVLALAQGGFFGLATCACGVPLAILSAIVWLHPSRRARPLPLVPLLLLGMTMAYLLSACVSGASLTTLSETGVWASCVCVSLLASAQDQTYRHKVLCALAWCGIAMAVYAVCVFVGVLPLVGGVTDGRLEFTFQYANAAAMWFGACTLLCLLGANKTVRSFAALPVAAMLLTQSAGAIVAFLVVSAAVGIWLARRGAWDALLIALVQGVLGVLLFAATVAIASPVALVVLVAAGVVCYVLHKRQSDLMSHVNVRTVTIVLTALLLVAFVLAAVALPIRIQQAHYSMVERMYHVRDGLALWMSKPLLGVGPDNWQYLFPYIQTAPYNVVVVHSSYVQVLDDAGVLGLAFLVAACVLGIRSLVVRCKLAKNAPTESSARDMWTLAELTIAVLLILHSILDFDLQFGALACLLAFVLSGPHALDTYAQGPQTEELRASSHPAKAAKGWMGGIAAVACVLLCLVGVYCSATSVALRQANAIKDYLAAERLFWSNPFALVDPAAQSEYLAAQFGMGNLREVTEAYALMAAPSDDSVVRVVTAWRSMDRPDQVATIFIDHLTATPYNKNIIDAARAYAQTVGIDPARRNEFDAALSKAMSLVNASELTTWWE